MTLGMEVGIGPGHIVLNGDPSPPKRGTASQFSAHVHCRQTAGWIKMQLGMEVGLSPDDFVLDGDPAPPPPKKKWAQPSNFPPMSIVAKQLDGSKCHLPRPRQHCVRWGLSSRPPKGHSPQFAADVYCGQTAGCIRIPLGTEEGLGQATLC